MTPFRQLSIRGKLMLVLLLTSSLSLLFSALGFAINDAMNLRAAMFERLRSQANILSATTLSALVFQDPTAATRTLASLGNEPAVLAAGIYSAQGELFASYRRENHTAPLPALPPGDALGVMGDHAYVVAPMHFANERVGSVFILSSFDFLHQLLREQALITLSVLFGSLLAAFLIAKRMQRLVSEPILRLARTARRVSRGRDFNLRAERLSNDEIGSLVDDFNNMLEQIQERDRRLQRHRDNLENQVQARTGELLELTRRLEHQAFHDELTGLANRALFDKLLNQALELARRDRSQLAVLFLDLDRFKTINDTLGHGAGDRVLIKVAERFRSALRRSDVIARLGGDEFALLLRAMKQPEYAADVAQKLIDLMSEPFEVEGYNLHLTTSVGICLHPEDGPDAETLLKKADTAMYRSKDLGRNRFEFFSEDMNIRAVQRLSVEHRLRRALREGELSTWYQPRRNTADGSIQVLECLVRWMDPEEGLVMPAEFIPLAEDCGLITAVDELVMRNALREVLGWYGERKPDIRLAINLSPNHFIRQDINQVVKTILEETGFPADRLELEITENILGPTYQDVGQTLAGFRSQGIRVAIDDFGTGYSSLGRLKELPIDILKIDRSFIRHLDTDEDDETITRTIIEMAYRLGLEVVAEGVETETQYRILREFGCRQAQGFLLGKPQPGQDTLQLLDLERRPSG